MTLAELKSLIARAETFGFKDEEVAVEFKTYSGLPLTVREAKASVVATEKNAKPILNITMGVNGY